MRDIDYFIDYERKYNETPSPEMEYIEGIGFEFPYEPLHFLRQKPFASLSTFVASKHGENGMSDVEWLMFNCFLGPFSGYFRSDMYHDEIPEIVIEMQQVLDSIIKKAPICEKQTLYRFLKEHDKIDFKIGEIFEPSHSLTTTTEDWGKDANMYVITARSIDKTKAHSLYKIYNHGNETQVNFERGTQFVVENIEYTDNRKIVYLKEI